VRKQVLFIQGAGEGAYEEDGRLAASLQEALGSTYEVRYPKIPNEGDIEYVDWKAQLDRELGALADEAILVGHSVGASVLLKYLSDRGSGKAIAGLFLIAAPYWGVDDFWKWDEARLPQDVPDRLAGLPRIFFYHSRDDEIVPFAHFALYAEKIPQAIFRDFEGRGHQFNNDLTEVAEDIRSL
jgi:predicted alpha/beta hydrolase family esterase